MDLTSGPGLEAGTFLSEYAACVVEKAYRDLITGEARGPDMVRARVHGGWSMGRGWACGMKVLRIVLCKESDIFKIRVVSV